MKILILKNCRTPLGEHLAGDTIETESRIGEYLVGNGYAKLPGGCGSTPQSAEATAPVEAETATIATPKGRKPRR